MQWKGANIIHNTQTSATSGEQLKSRGKSRDVSVLSVRFKWALYGIALWSLCPNKVCWSKKNLSAEHQWATRKAFSFVSSLEIECVQNTWKFDKLTKSERFSKRLEVNYVELLYYFCSLESKASLPCLTFHLQRVFPKLAHNWPCTAVDEDIIQILEIPFQDSFTLICILGTDAMTLMTSCEMFVYLKVSCRKTCWPLCFYIILWTGLTRKVACQKRELL